MISCELIPALSTSPILQPPPLRGNAGFRIDRLFGSGDGEPLFGVTYLGEGRVARLEAEALLRTFGRPKTRLWIRVYGLAHGRIPAGRDGTPYKIYIAG